MTSDLVVVLTALELEYTAVREKLDSPQLHRHDKGTHFEVGTLAGSSCRIALVQCGKGNHPSAVVAERAIQHYSPAAVLFVGVAGALSDRPALGDVVVATHVYGYHGATSEDDSTKARPRSWETSHKLTQAAMSIARTDDWSRPAQVHDAEVRFGPIAAGEVVQNARSSYEAEWLREHYNDALAIEMEAAGVAQAGHFNEVPVGIVRGISDRADGTKNSHNDTNWQPMAARSATAFAVRLAMDLTTQQGASMQADTPRHSPGFNFGDGNTIGLISQGDAHNNTVTMNVGEPERGPVDFGVALDEIRDLLDRERHAGTIDEDTYAAAQEDLDTADKALQDDDPDSPGRAKVALRRLKGLLDEIADLAVKVASVITAVNAL